MTENASRAVPRHVFAREARFQLWSRRSFLARSRRRCRAGEAVRAPAEIGPGTFYGTTGGFDVMATEWKSRAPSQPGNAHSTARRRTRPEARIVQATSAATLATGDFSRRRWIGCNGLG